LLGRKQPRSASSSRRETPAPGVPVPFHRGPLASRPPSDRPDSSSWTQTPRHRPGSWHPPPVRHALTQGLPRTGSGGPATGQTQRGYRQDPGLAGRRGPSLGDQGPAKHGLDRANWTHEELADHLFKTRGLRTSRSAIHLFCRKIGIRPYQPTYRFLRGDPGKQAKAREELAGLKKQAEAGELVLLSQDEARFPMVPKRGATLGVNGHRPIVGTRDGKDLW
jgi:hypothetical protein